MASNPPRPPNERADTTLVNSFPTIKENLENLSKVEAGDTQNDPQTSVRDVQPAEVQAFHAQINTTLHAENPPDPTVIGTTHLYDVVLLAGIFSLLAWPWIFFGLVWQSNGLEMNIWVASVVKENPQPTSYFVTLVGTITGLFVGFFFSAAIVRLAQEWVANRTSRKKGVTIFHVSLLLAVSSRRWPWKLKDLRHLFAQQRWLPMALVGACIVTFAFVPSSTTSLIGPVPFNRTTGLSGYELNFESASSDFQCVDWFKANLPPNTCDWKLFKGMWYTNCLGQNQLVDVLESGRGNILSLLSNNTESLVLSQLGTQGLHFLGPIRGVLPMGPNGVAGFDTVNVLPSVVREQPYNYTLDHQGLVSKVNCRYDHQPSPVRPQQVDSTRLMMKYNGTCPADTVDFLSNRKIVEYVAPYSNNSLVFWACKSQPSKTEEPSYTIYLRGLNNYKQTIDNITCDVSSMQPAIFPVRYQSKLGIFTTGNWSKVSRAILADHADLAVMSVGTAIQESQNTKSNLFAESVITFGVKSLKLTDPYKKTEQYLRLYEAMIQGVLEYETTYLRLIFSTIPDPPLSCRREVKGSFSHETFGWHTTLDHIGFLLPMTLINLVSLIVMIIVVVMARQGVCDHDLDPTDPISLIWARHEHIERHEWHDNVTYHPRHAFQMLKKTPNEKVATQEMPATSG